MAARGRKKQPAARIAPAVSFPDWRVIDTLIRRDAAGEFDNDSVLREHIDHLRAARVASYYKVSRGRPTHSAERDYQMTMACARRIAAGDTQEAALECVSAEFHCDPKTVQRAISSDSGFTGPRMLDILVATIRAGKPIVQVTTKVRPVVPTRDDHKK